MRRPQSCLRPISGFIAVTRAPEAIETRFRPNSRARWTDTSAVANFRCTSSIASLGQLRCADLCAVDGVVHRELSACHWRPARPLSNSTTFGERHKKTPQIESWRGQPGPLQQMYRLELDAKAVQAQLTSRAVLGEHVASNMRALRLDFALRVLMRTRIKVLCNQCAATLSQMAGGSFSHLLHSF